MLAVNSDTALIPNEEFAKLATDEQIERTASALEANNIHTLIAEDGEEAKRLFFELVPEGVEEEIQDRRSPLIRTQVSLRESLRIRSFRREECLEEEFWTRAEANPVVHGEDLRPEEDRQQDQHGEKGHAGSQDHSSPAEIGDSHPFIFHENRGGA